MGPYRPVPIMCPLFSTITHALTHSLITALFLVVVTLDAQVGAAIAASMRAELYSVGLLRLVIPDGWDTMRMARPFFIADHRMVWRPILHHT